MKWLASGGGVLLALALSTAYSQDSKTKTRPEPPLIRTDVRQVVVPVVVFDKKHHYVRGLAASDFSVFEDGLEQKIVAFQGTGVPDEGIGGSTSAVSKQTPVNVHGASVASPRRTYLICVDSLHASMGNFVAARKALTKFFQHEHDEEAQYVLISLGLDVKAIQDSTRDPAGDPGCT